MSFCLLIAKTQPMLQNWIIQKASETENVQKRKNGYIFQWGVHPPNL
jgi:hypothetical protein